MCEQFQTRCVSDSDLQSRNDVFHNECINKLFWDLDKNSHGKGNRVLREIFVYKNTPYMECKFLLFFDSPFTSGSNENNSGSIDALPGAKLLEIQIIMT